MGARKKVKETYSKARQIPANEEEKRKRFKERKVIPKFTKLFLHKTGNQENNRSEDDFETRLVKKKPYAVLEKSGKNLKCKRPAKPLTPSSFFTNSTYGSVGHSSANDTFDKLVGLRSRGRVPPPSSCSKNAEFSSTSCSSYENSGILYESLLSRPHSKLHCSVENEPKIRLGKKVIDKSSKLFKKLDLISEHGLPDNTPVESHERLEDGKPACPSSPQLFSSSDERENIQGHLNEKSKRKAKKATKATVTLRSRPKKDISARKGLSVINISQSSDESDRKSDSLKRSVSPETESPDCIKKPLLEAGPREATYYSPFIEEEILVSKNTPTSSEFLNESNGKSIVTNFANIFSGKSHTVSQDISASLIFQRSQGSVKSSVKSDVVTSTPADTSRLHSAPSSITPWKLKFDSTLENAISPVPRNAGNVANVSSPSVFHSPMSFKYNFTACSDKKSSCNPSHGSHYHSCFMEGTRASDIVKPTVSPFKTENAIQSRLDSGSKTSDRDRSPKFYNSSLELKCGFKGVAIPSPDATRELTDASPEQSPQSYSRECDIKEPSVKNDLNVQDSAMNSFKGKLCEKQVCSSQMSFQNALQLQDISSEKLKTINSFLNRPSFVIPRRPRMKLKSSKNWIEPSPAARRLTRRANCLLKLEKINDQKNLTSSSLGENIQTDSLSVEEPSIILPRREMVKGWGMSCTSIENVSKSSSLVSRELSILSVATNDELSVVLPRRTSVRLAKKRQTFGKYRELNNSSLSDVKNSPHVLIKRGLVSTRPAAKRWQNKKEKVSYLQSDSSRFSSAFSIEASKSVITSFGLESGKESCSCTKEITECEKSSVEESLKNNSVNNEDLVTQEFKNEVDNTTDAIESLVLGTSKAKFEPSEETDVSIIDTSMGDVFEAPFCTTVSAKRGKGWIRSLSIARASLIGAEGVEQMSEFVRRQTVHRISMSAGVRRLSQHRILPLPKITDKIIKEMGETDNEDEDTSMLSQSILSDARRHVLSLCSQTEPLPMMECFTQSLLSSCKKIGEGVYGEVFMTKPNPNNLDGAKVLKIMPIEGDFEVNGEPQKKFEEILSEIIISMELSNLRHSSRSGNQSENFVHLLKCWCVEGSYPPDLLQLWDHYHEEKGSENDRPDIFPDSQLSIVLEFTHGGGDLESFVFNNAGQSLAVFLQIAYSLAVAEHELEFEHRDLHWGNVLVATTKDSSVDFKINEGAYKLQTQCVKATVIDFTLSRLKAPHCVVYNNLADDPSLFTAQGDYQFEIYREMKNANRNDWQKFTPYTNVLWLHYILDKMISECYYKNIKTKVHKRNLEYLKELKETILQSESALAFVLRREHN